MTIFRHSTLQLEVLPKTWLRALAHVKDPLCRSLMSRRLQLALTIFSSCTLCRRRKVRCNRETPCSNCMRSKTGSCVYETQSSLDQRLDKRALSCIQPQHDVPGPIVGSTMPSRVSTTSSSSSTEHPTDGSNYAAFELEAMRTRITELEDKLSRASSVTTNSPFSDAASTPASTHSVRTFSCLATTVDVLEDTRSPNGASISRSVAHKNRVFGQSHWMNGFVMVQTPCFRSKRTQLLTMCVVSSNA